MQLLRLPNRWQSSLIAVLGTALCVSFVAWHRSAANDPPKSNPDADLAAKVDVNVPSFLRVAGRHRYAVPVRITSKSERPLQGPLFLVVEGTSIAELSADNADGTTADQEPYFRYLTENDSLTPKEPSVTRKLQFKSGSNPLRSKQRDQFQLEYRLTRDISQAGPEATRQVRLPTRRPGFPNRSAGGNRGSRTSSGESGKQQADDADDPPGDDSQTKNKGDDSAEKDRPRRDPYALNPGITNEDIQKVIAIQDKATPELMAKQGVVGTATGVNADGDLVIRVYAQRHGVMNDLPEKIDGIPVEMRVIGQFRPLFFQPPPQDKQGQAGQPKARPPVDDPTQRFPRPIPIGVSGINETLPFCATGTIGCRVKGADGTLYVLSNNHVLADENNAPLGDNILQPGPLDNNCVVDPADSIGTLAAFVPVDFTGLPNVIDAALAEVTADTVSNTTPDGAYGIPNSHTVPPALGMKVQKMGRTTLYTTGRITAVNVTAFVIYANGLALFEDQIEITHPILSVTTGFPGRISISLKVFAGPGDSGSLIVSNPQKNPVGLLFAGSTFFTLANPLESVLDGLEQEVGQDLQIDGEPSNAGP